MPACSTRRCGTSWSNRRRSTRPRCKVFATTPPYFDYNWTVRGDLDPALVKKLTDAFLKLDPDNPEHKEIDGPAARQPKFIPTKAENYDGIEAARGSGMLSRSDQVAQRRLRHRVARRTPAALRLSRPSQSIMSFQLHAAGLAHANGHRALHDCHLAAQAGERIAVIGPSGAGKTSLLRLLGTSLRPTEGRVSVLGDNPWQLGAGELRRLRSRIGVVHQAPPMPPRQRVVTAILAGRLGRWPWWKSLLSLLYPADIAGARAQLARLDLADRLFERCDRLSGGQLQRVGVARVLYQRRI